MLVNKTVEFFLSEVAGSERDAGGGRGWADSGLGAARNRRRPKLGLKQDAGGG